MTNSTYNFPYLNDIRLEKSILAWSDFIASINSKEKVGLIYHGDMDGLVGAVYMRRNLLNKFPDITLMSFWIATDEYDFLSLRNWVDTSNFDRLLIVDISIENHLPTLQYINEKVHKKIFIYDHHIVNNTTLYPNKIIVANPTPSKLINGEMPVPSFVFAYKIAQNEKLVFPEWLLLLSIFAEGVDNYFRKDIENLLEYLNFRAKKPVRQIYQSSPLSKINHLIGAEFASFDKTEHTLELFDSVATGKIQKVDDILFILKKRLGPISSERSDEISKYVDLWKNKIQTELMGDVVIVVPVESKYAISGPVASILRGHYPDKVFISYYLRENTIIVELRTRNDTHLNLVSILENISKDVNFINYGGHPSAAGASFTKPQIDVFLEKIKAELLKD